MRQQAEQIRHQQTLEAEYRMEQMRSYLENQREAARLDRELAAKQQETAMGLMFDKFKALLEAQTRIDVAQISANAVMTNAQDQASDEAVA